jgi:hypothetical protein
MRCRALGKSLFAGAKFKSMEMSMSAQNKGSEKSQPERRIVKTYYDEITRIIEFRVFVVQPDGKKVRVLGGGAFEERDVYCVAEELMKLTTDFACDEAQADGFLQDIEEDEGEDG